MRPKLFHVSTRHEAYQTLKLASSFCRCHALKLGIIYARLKSAN